MDGIPPVNFTLVKSLVHRLSKARSFRVMAVSPGMSLLQERGIIGIDRMLDGVWIELEEGWEEKWEILQMEELL